MAHVCVVIVLAIAIFVSGCVAIPLPPVERQTSSEELNTIKVGVTSRDEVRSLLGEATVLDHPRFMITDVQKSAARFLVLTVGGGHGIVPYRLERHRVLLEFGQDGQLTSTRILPLPSKGLEALEASEGEILDAVGARAPPPPQIHSLAGVVPRPSFWTPDRTLASSAINSSGNRTFASGDFAPDGRLLAVGTTSGGLLVFDTDNGSVQTVSVEDQYDPASTRAVAFSPDGRRVVSGGINATVWDIAKRTATTTFTGHGKSSFFNTQWVSSVAYSPTSKTIASGDRRGFIRIWNPESGREQAKIKAHHTSIHSLAFSPNGTVLAVIAGRTLMLWDALTGKQLAVSDHRQPRPQGVTFSRDARRLAINWMTHVEIWLLPSSRQGFGQLEKVFLLPPRVNFVYGRTPSIAFSPDDKTLAVVNGGAIFINLSNGVLTRPFGRFSYAGIFSPDGRRFVTIGPKGIDVWDAQAPIWSEADNS